MLFRPLCIDILNQTRFLIKLAAAWKKTTNCLGENKGADQLRGNRKADQRLCFRYTDRIIHLLLKYKISSL